MSKPKEEAIQTKYTLCKGIEDLYPYELELPTPPPAHEIINYGLPKSEQVFRRVVIPKDVQRLNMLPREQAIAAAEANPEIAEFIERMWYKFTYGEWQYINGKALHISPTYWFYLNFWKLDAGLPKFRYDLTHFTTDLWEFAWWDYIVQPSDVCFGEIQATLRKAGKCFGVDTPIRMYDGSIKKVQDIQEGDLVMGDDSTPRRAYGITKGREKMYRIIPNKGDYWECNESHILSLYYNSGFRNPRKGWEPHSFVTITVKEYLTLSDSDKDHLCLYRRGWGNNYEHKSHDIPPYMLGIYLGDGCKKTGNITSVDKEIICYVNEFAGSFNLGVTKNEITYRIVRNSKKTGSCPVTITVGDEKHTFSSIRKMNERFGWTHQSMRHTRKWFKDKYKPEYEYNGQTNPYRQALKDLGIMPEKRIPKEYLIDSEENRLQLLAGILDTDGHLHILKGVCKMYEVTQKRKDLAYDIVELARSLGFYVSINKKNAVLKRKNKQDYNCEVYRISIYGDIYKIPCKVERKKCHTVKRRKDSRNTGFKVVDIGEGDYYGFAVDKNHLFLLADGTVVHNTYKALCKAYKRIISKRNAMGCIQSKTDDDAADAFTVKMVTPVLNLPFFFKPYQANSMMPKKEGFRFMPKSGKSDKDVSLNPDDYLFSSIEYRASGETAADGPKWYVHVTDEDGKAKEVDVWERHRVVLPALTQDEMIYGKELTTTTVEEMEKGGGLRFWYKWVMSDRNPNKEKKDLTVDERGKTASGLWQWFCPARCAVVWDKYGCAIIEEPTPEQQEWLKNVRKDPQYKIGGRERIRRKIDALKSQQDRHSEMRKFPEEVRDMFLSASGRCYFDLGILNERLKYFAMGYPKEMATQMTFGNFHWKGGVFGGEVEFIPTDRDSAKNWISYLPRMEHRNKWKIDDYTGKKIPGNWHKFCAGADAFKFDTEDVINKKDMSLGAMHIYAEYDINVDVPGANPQTYVTDDICLEYLWREDTMTVDDLCEDYLKACIFYGCKLFPEKNNPEVVSYFKRHGFENYLQFDMQYKSQDGAVFLQEKGGAGANTDSKSVQSMFKVVQRYVKEKGLRCKFYRTLEQLKHVSPDPKGMNPYDLFVSLATCLRVVQEFNPITLKEDEQAELDVSDIKGIFSSSVPNYRSDDEEGGYGTDAGTAW